MACPLSENAAFLLWGVLKVFLTDCLWATGITEIFWDKGVDRGTPCLRQNDFAIILPLWHTFI